MLMSFTFLIEAIRRIADECNIVQARTIGTKRSSDEKDFVLDDLSAT